MFVCLFVFLLYGEQISTSEDLWDRVLVTSESSPNSFGTGSATIRRDAKASTGETEGQATHVSALRLRNDASCHLVACIVCCIISVSVSLSVLITTLSHLLYSCMAGAGTVPAPAVTGFGSIEKEVLLRLQCKVMRTCLR